MSDTTNHTDNIYHADYHVHSRKGKIMDKHNKARASKKIRQFKAKNNIGSDTWLSAYDVHKAVSDKKHAHVKATSVRAKGHDYKLFLQACESPRNENDFRYDLTQQDLDDYNQTECGFYSWPDDFGWPDESDWPDNYSDCLDERSYSDEFDDIWSYWDYREFIEETRSTCSGRTNRTTRTLM